MRILWAATVGTALCLKSTMCFAQAELKLIPAPNGCHVIDSKILGAGDQFFIKKEDTALLRIRGPGVGATAKLDCKMESYIGWKAGFVQVIKESNIRLSFQGAGLTSQLSESPLLDSHAQRRPWLSDSSRPLTRTLEVNVTDLPDTYSGWFTRKRLESGVVIDNLPLESVSRTMAASLYLVALNTTLGEYFVLGRVDWSTKLEATIDVGKELGQRVSVVQAENNLGQLQRGNDNSLTPKIILGPRVQERHQVKAWP